MRSDFEKLVIAKQYIKILRIESGVLKSEKAELRYLLDQKNKLTTEEKKEIKRDELLSIYRKKNASANKTIKQLRKDKETLIIKLNQKPLIN